MKPARGEEWTHVPASRCVVIDRTMQRGHEETHMDYKRALERSETGDQLKDAVLAGFRTLEEWQADTERRFAGARTSLHGGDNLKSAIPPYARGQLAQAEQIVKAQQSRAEREGRHAPFGGDVVLKAAVGAWFRGHLTKLARPGEFHSLAAEHAKLESALGFGPVERAAMSEISSGVGGALVPTIVESEILRLTVDNSVLRRAGVRQVPMTTKTHAYPTRASAFSAAIIAEEGSITDSAPATPFSQSSLTAKKLACYATVSGELMQDNVVLLADYLAQEFGEQIGRLEDTQALEGDGTGNNFTGVIAAANVNSVVSGTNGEVLYWNKLTDVPWAATEMASRQGGAWFLGPKLMKVLVKSRADAVSGADNAGLPIFVSPSMGIGQPAPQTLLGFPYVVHSGLRTDITRGTGTNLVNAYFGPPQTIIFGDLLGFTVDLNPWAKFQTFQIDIRGLKRTGILVAVPTAWTKYVAIDPTAAMKP
jgi:HK97 family phage major capsid protein